MTHLIFISHSSKDRLIADSVCSILEKEDLKCWIAPRDIPPGQEWPVAIVNAVVTSKLMVLIFSDNANHSQDVAKETLLAIKSDIPVFPVKIEDSEPKGAMIYYLADKEWHDVSNQPLPEEMKNVVNTIRKAIPHVEDKQTIFNGTAAINTEAVLPPKEKGLSHLIKNKPRLLIAAAVFLLIASMMIFFFSPNRQTDTAPSMQDSAVDNAGQAGALPADTSLAPGFEENLAGNMRGNTPGNLNNFGLVAAQDDIIYLAYQGDSYRIYKFNPGEEGYSKLNDDGSRYLNVIGDWIYYINVDELNSLYKIRTDGSERTLISSDRAWNLSVLGDWLYYINEDDNNTIYKIRTDGTGRTRVNNNASAYINLTEDWIYFSNLNDSERIYRIRSDGSERSPVNDEPSRALVVDEDWIFYLSMIEREGYSGDGSDPASQDIIVAEEPVLDDMFLCKIRPDGSGRITVGNINGHINYFNLDDNWVYYNYTPSYSMGNDMARTDKNGFNYRELPVSGYYINLASDWVFVNTYIGVTFYMRPDGSDAQMVDIN